MLNFVKNIIKNLIGEVTTDRLVKRGMLVGHNFNRQQGCFIDPTHCWLITIGNNVTLSIRVTILAHDASTKEVTNGYTKIGRVAIGNNVFIGANTTILPNVTIGDNVIIGANSVVSRDVASNTVVAGNPARHLYTIEQYRQKVNLAIESSPRFDESYTMRQRVTDEKKRELVARLNNRIGFIE